EAPFERIVEGLRAGRDAGPAQLARVLFGARDAVEGFEAHGLSVEHDEWGQGSAGFDLAVEIDASADAVRGRVTFPAGLFAEATVRRLLEQYQALLVAVAADPETGVDVLALDTEEALQQVLADGTGEPRQLPARPLHELLRERAASSPAAIAVEWEG